MTEEAGFQVRAFDATTVHEPGPTGSLWRIHYSVNLPSLGCDFFKVTPTKGPGTGESFRQFPIRAGDYVLADRGYSTAAGIQHVAAAGAHLTVRVNTGSMPLTDPDGGVFELLKSVETLSEPGRIGVWRTRATARTGQPVPGRVCALRKTDEAIEVALKSLRRQASKKGRKLKPETLRFARYVILFTTYPPDRFPAAEVLEWYRLRWQVELVSSGSSLWRNSDTCPSMTTKAPRLGCTGSCWWLCWSRRSSATRSLFPPGDTPCHKDRNHSPWRDFKFALNQVTRAIEPALPIAQMIDHWHAISAGMAEPPRKRTSQVDRYFPLQ